MQGVVWQCPEGQHNDLATGFWSSPDELISRLFSVGHTATTEITIDSTGFSQPSLLIFSAIYLIMLALCAGICVPAGMFMPAIVLGAATGLAAGVALQTNLPDFHIQPGTPGSLLPAVPAQHSSGASTAERAGHRQHGMRWLFACPDLKHPPPQHCRRQM